MKRKLPYGLGLAAVLALTLSVQAAVREDVRDRFFREGTLRVLIFSGRNNHDWRSSTPYLKGLLESTGRFDVRLEEEPDGTTPRTLAPYDLLVFDYMGPRWCEATEKAVAEFVAGGKGLVLVHGANYAFCGMEVLGDGHVRTGIKEPPWPEYAKLAGGVWSEEEPKSGHGRRHSFKVRFTDPAHPVAAGMGESFSATDELYHNVHMNPAAKILAVAWSDPATGGTGKDEPLLWTVEYGKGRVFYTALGHDLVAMSESGFIQTFLRGCEWATAGKVTVPADYHPAVKKAGAVRSLVVTGGHDYETGFYTLFESADLTWDHAVSNHEAFASAELRDKYDVLVLYDLSREISEAEKENLRAFLESGKGLVVLHHALADYNGWPWWWKEVVGGRYLLEPEGGQPASTYKHGVELFATLEGSHPITAGLSPFHLMDETYKGMWISPEVTIILKTEEPTSDGPLAWVSPYAKSRVAVIQLGHDSQTFRYPGYRELVHRAILWSAGKLE